MEDYVYLAGPIRGLSYTNAVDWRDSVKAILRTIGISTLSPMRAKDMLKGIEVLDSTLYPVNHPLTIGPGVISRDRDDVRNCRLILANLLGAERVSIGTCVEFGWADAYRKPIILVMEEEGNPHEHLFIHTLASYQVTTLDEALFIVRAILLP